MDRHVIEALGRTRVVIENGRVAEVGTPLLDYCPLFMKHRGITEISSDVVHKNIDFRIADFGMCTPRRQLRMRDFLTFGTSELMAMAISEGILDSVVMVCDGAGTVVITDPILVQGIGGRMSGIIQTTPYPEIVDSMGRERVLDPETGKIDTLKGVELAKGLGFERIGVTLVSAEEAETIRRRFGDDIALFAVHTTGVTENEARRLFDTCDIITACASKWIRQMAPKRSLLSVGNKIPVYAATELGKRILEKRLSIIGTNKSIDSDDLPRPLV